MLTISDLQICAPWNDCQRGAEGQGAVLRPSKLNKISEAEPSGPLWTGFERLRQEPTVRGMKRSFLRWLDGG